MKKLITEYTDRVKQLDFQIESINRQVRGMRKIYSDSNTYLQMSSPLVEERRIADAKRTVLFQVIKDLEDYA